MGIKREKAIRFIQISNAEDQGVAVDRAASAEENEVALILKAWIDNPSDEMTGRELQKYEDEVNAKATFVYPVSAKELIKRFSEYEKKVEMECCWLCKFTKAPEAINWAYWSYHKGVSTGKRKSDDLLILSKHRAIPTVNEMVQFADIIRVIWPPDALLIPHSDYGHFYIRAQAICCGRAGQ